MKIGFFLWGLEMYKVLFLVASLVISAQSMMVTGRVTSAVSKDPVSAVIISAGEIYSLTDINGRFEIEINEATFLRVEKIGYLPVNIEKKHFVSDLQIELEIDPFILSEVVIESNFKDKALSDISSSVSVRNAEQIQSFGGSHFQQIIESVPNMHWAGGTSRPRYLQIRGIGERSQYAGDGPPDFSVGYYLDGVDLSGLSVGAMFDIGQVEVFRGPQSTVFGPNSLAGAVNVKSIEPTSVFSGKVRMERGSDGLMTREIVVNTPFNENFSTRLGYQSSRANGFRYNKFSDRDDTNKRNEEVFRLKGRYLGSSGILYKMTAFVIDIDNGYEMWAPDNNTDLNTYSNQLGSDDLDLKALALFSEWPIIKDEISLTSISTIVRADMDYSYDGDWGNDSYWLKNYGFDPDEQGWNYEFFDKTLRTREVFSQEMRLKLNEVRNWNFVAGMYAKTLQESDDANGYLLGGSVSSLDAEFENTSLAAYFAADRMITPKTTFVFNSRLERSDLDYAGLTDIDRTTLRFNVSDWLWGGNISLINKLTITNSIYFTLSRGYLTGGINQHPKLVAINRPYEPEHMINIEIGHKWLTSEFSIQTSLFYSLRSDQQVSLSTQQDPEDPNSFFFYRANAAKGRNSGIEVESNYSFSPSLRTHLSLALLDSYVNSFEYTGPNGVELSGDRESAHAPQYRTHFGIEWSSYLGFFAKVAGTHTSDFYFSESHNESSDAYSLVDGSFGYVIEGYRFEGWIRNIFDERYATRGFFFSLEPPDYKEKLYKSYGDPRQIGLRFTKDW